MLRVFGSTAGWLLLVAGCGISGFAQDYMIKTWGVDDGLPESSITDAVQSRDGYLWVSTLNSGVARFDGVRFVNFSLPFASPFPSGGVRRLFADQDGNLWLNGFGNYLASLQDGVFQLEPSQPAVINYLVEPKSGSPIFVTKEGRLLERASGIGSNSVWQVVDPPGAGQNSRFFADESGSIWYRSTNGEACRLTGQKVEAMPPPLGDGTISILAGDSRGEIAVGNAAGLFVWAGNQFKAVTLTNEEPAVVVKGLVSDGQGGWWVEANGRLRRCRDRDWIAEAADWLGQHRVWSKVRWEQPDTSGGLWLAYTDGGVVHVSATGKLSALTTRDGLPSNRVRTLSLDREGNAWASFERGGLVRIRPRLFQAIGSREGLSDSVTTSVGEDDRGAIWIGTLGGTVSCWDHEVCSNFTLPLEGTHCEMSTVFPEAGGRVWIGTHGNGVLVYDGGEFRHVLSPDQVGANIRGIFVSRDHRVWIASQDGLYCYTSSGVQRVLSPKSEADYPAAVTEGSDGTIWVAMNTGRLLKITGGEMRSFQPAEAAMQSRFTAVYADYRGTVWIGTLGAGLLIFRDGQFTAVTHRNGLPSDYISQVIEDGAGRLWLGSPAGVASVTKRSLESSGQPVECHIFGCDDGLPTVGCATASQPTIWRGHDGRIWFATANGVTAVQPQDPAVRQNPPLVVLEEMLVDGQSENLSSSRIAGANLAPIRLSPGRHHLEFRFTGLNFAAPERIRFEYMLEGLDTTWIESRTERVATYNSVPPGQYRFRVMACDNDGVWSETESSPRFVLPPHVWETRWFRVSALAAALLVVAGSVFWILRALYRRQLRILEQQQALERERTRIAQDIHDDLGTSLTRITMLSQSAMNKAGAAGSPGSEVTRIYATARAMTHAMDEIVWAINPRHDSIESVAAYFAEFVEEFLSPTDLHFRINFPLSLPAWPINAEVRHNLFLAFKEALNNVVKHSQASEVVVTLAIHAGGFALIVEDNGRGFETAVSGNGSDPAWATGGNGLNNIRQRLEDLGGRCVINSVPGQGTRVTFEIDL